MEEFGIIPLKHSLQEFGLDKVANVYWNLSPSELVQKTIRLSQGQLADSGALVCNTGEFTGRSPKDKYIVEDEITKNTVWWGAINQKFSPEKFSNLYNRVASSLTSRNIYIRDVYACANPEFRLRIRIITETPWQDLFANNLFIRPSEDELKSFTPEWTVLAVPSFRGLPSIDGTRQHNFTIINFTKKIHLIGGSAYIGEIKKGVFTAANFLLPKRKALPMHCAANTGKKGDTALFFGLSGTGKTTLSADPERNLIGDDEHGWSDNEIFNFEGGCYAKCVNLSKEKEPQIYDAIRFGTLLENVTFFPGTREVDYTNISITENTRAAYPLHFIDNAVEPSIGGVPSNIFFLTCDAFGVLPPISKLSPAQAMYHFISGYTAKVAGTEAGITEPQTTFSACFGEPFLPLHPAIYAELLGEKLKKYKSDIWLINTGWSGGKYGYGRRIKLAYTRALIHAALSGSLLKAKYQIDPVFGLKIPTTCSNVPEEILFPRNTWHNKDQYDEAAKKLVTAFTKNFEKYSPFSTSEIIDGAMGMSPKKEEKIIY